MIRSKTLALVAAGIACLIAPLPGRAIGGPHYVSSTPAPGSFALVDHSTAAPLVVSDGNWPGVVRAAGDLGDDIKRVTGEQPAMLHTGSELRNADAVIIGTLGKSALIDDLIRRNKLDVTGVAGKWESAVTTMVDRPMPGVARALSSQAATSAARSSACMTSRSRSEFHPGTGGRTSGCLIRRRSTSSRAAYPGRTSGQVSRHISQR